MDFQIACESDRQQVEDLWAYCFEKPDHPFFQWYFRSWESSNTLCGFEQQQLTACVHLNPYHLLLRGRILPVSYIVGLATAPQARRGGAAGNLLRAALAEMRQRQHYFNILMPSKAGFYYPYGWELCYHQLKYRADLDDLRGITVREGTFIMADPRRHWQQFAQVYNCFVAARHGYAVREAAEWLRLLESHQAEKGYAVLLFLDNEPVGYLLYHVRDGLLLIGDMAYTSWQAQRCLIGYIYNHRSQADQVEWNSPADDLLHLVLPNPKQGVSLHPFMAGRIVDVSGALTALRYPASVGGQLKLAVADPLAEWNEGLFSLTVEDGIGRVDAVSGGAADIVCDIGTLSLLVFGRLSVQEALYKGGMTANNETSLALLQHWFPRMNNYINEYF